MRPSLRFYSSLYKPWLRTRPAIHAHGQLRAIATHTYNHHATALSILTSNIDKSSNDFVENARQMAEVMARMEGLHHKIEGGGPAKAREKHLARGKMLTREYDSRRGYVLVLWLMMLRSTAELQLLQTLVPHFLSCLLLRDMRCMEAMKFPLAAS